MLLWLLLWLVAVVVVLAVVGAVVVACIFVLFFLIAFGLFLELLLLLLLLLLTLLLLRSFLYLVLLNATLHFLGHTSLTSVLICTNDSGLYYMRTASFYGLQICTFECFFLLRCNIL